MFVNLSGPLSKKATQTTRPTWVDNILKARANAQHFLSNADKIAAKREADRIEFARLVALHEDEEKARLALYRRNEKAIRLESALRMADAAQNRYERAGIRVLNAASWYFNFPKDVILSRKRIVPLCTARHIMAYVAYNFTNASFPSLAPVFHRDHSTLVNSVKVIQERLNSGCTETAEDVDALCRIIGVTVPPKINPDSYFGA